MQTLAHAHHDGSALYVDADGAQLGDTVTVRMRTSAEADVDRVWLRTVSDAEPLHLEARPDGERDGERWFAADLPLHNPVTSYRFLLQSGGEVTWLNAAGLSRRDVTDAHDHRIVPGDPAPAWLQDSVVYQVFPDRFAPDPTGAQPTLPDWAFPARWDQTPDIGSPRMGREIYGGTLGGIESRLDHLSDLGVTTLYLTPVFPGRSNHRYDASTFDAVDPLLGGDAALASLRRATRARGMRLMGDLTTNHTGKGHEWFEASQDPTSPEAPFYMWNATRDDWIGWLGHRHLPKLDWRSPELRARMVTDPGSAVRRWLAEPYALDGWRIDVANMTGRHGATDVNGEVAALLRATVAADNPDAAVVAEHFHDASADLTRGGWDATMNYAGFLRPAWQWMAAPGTAVRYLDAPVPVPSRSGREVVGTMRDVLASAPWAVAARGWNALSTHDTARIRTVAGAARHAAAAVLQYTYPGAPFLFAGDEGGLEGVTGEHSRTPMPWDAIDGSTTGWDHAAHALYRRLGRLRRDTCALRHGGLRWALAEDDALVYLRECAHERVVVAVARDSVRGRAAALGTGVASLEPLLDGAAGDMDARLADHTLSLTTGGAAAGVWRIHA